MTKLRPFLALSLWILLGFCVPNASPGSLLLTEGKPSNDLGQQDDYALEPNHKLIYHKTSLGWDNGTALGGAGGVIDGQQLFDGSHLLSLDAGLRRLYDSDEVTIDLGWGGGSLDASVPFHADSLGNETGDYLANIDLLNRRLYAANGTTEQVRWDSANNITFFTDKARIMSDGTNSFEYLDNLRNVAGDGLANIDLLNRKLYASNGTTVILDWHNVSAVSSSLGSLLFKGVDGTPSLSPISRTLHVTDNFGYTNIVGDFVIVDWHLASNVGFFPNSSGQASTAIYYNGLLQVGMAGPPGTSTIAEGTGGSTHYQYGVTAVDLLGNETDLQADDFNGGNAVLDSTNKNLISWTASPGAASYNVYRTQSAGTPSTTGKIGNTTSTSFEDTGLAGDGTLGPSISQTGYIVDMQGAPGSPVIAIGKRQGIYGTGGINGSQTVIFDWSDPTRFKFFDGTSYVKSNGVYHMASFTVATLPAGAIGDLAYVTDATAPTYGATVVGGGAVVIPVFYNGTNWTAH